ncbi:hypothetical protein F5I97DRAFT_1928694 [Phlebopus sp. FC_14]|nr:hypothetical protein F5I97DRAFT_1928694 [Phlebopus sp. FC_14]
MSPTPSAILTDALASFNKAANLAFTAAQDQARKDITQATADTREARRERDEAVKALHSCRLEEQAWKQEASVWKAAADQADLTIKHHLETIAQLRQEATQWKDQCLRLEETSRQEAISWKEQFLRVEQERYKLAQRVDELVAEQLSGNQTQVSTTPFTPMLRYSGVGDLSASTRLQQLPAAQESLLLEADETSTRPTTSKSKPSSSTRKPRQVPVVQLPTPISENQRGARQRALQPVPPSHPSSRPRPTSGERQVLIRRVQAVVEVPVKEESVDDDEISAPAAPASASTSSASASASASASKTSSNVDAARASKAATRVKRAAGRKEIAKRPYVEIDEDSAGERDDSEVSEQSDDADMVDSEDDELMLGAEDNRKEVYGIQRITKTAPPKTPSHALQAGKKRKLAVSATERKKSRPSAKSRV